MLSLEKNEVIEWEASQSGALLADPEKICCERLDLLCRNGVIEK